jgi:hypothetical protein
MNRRRVFGIFPGVIGVIGVIGVSGVSVLILSFAPHLDGPREWGEAAAAWVGALSFVFLFQRWRSGGDHAARAWCLAGFGVWVVTVILGSFDDGAAAITAGLAGSIEFVGALTTVVQLAGPRRQSGPAPLGS